MIDMILEVIAAIVIIAIIVGVSNITSRIRYGCDYNDMRQYKNRAWAMSRHVSRKRRNHGWYY